MAETKDMTGKAGGATQRSGIRLSTCIAVLITLGVVGSLVTFFGLNLLMSDLANMYYTSLNKDILSSFPFFIFSLDFVAATLFVARVHKHPDQARALVNLYTILLAAFSAAGVVFSVLAGVLVYDSFFAPYPFWCYTFVCLVAHAVLFVAGVVLNVVARRRLPEDTDRRHVKPKYVGYTVIQSVLAFFAFDRFGALLTALVYAQVRTLGLTWPFYLTLLLPLVLLVYSLGTYLGMYARHRARAVVTPSVVLVCNIVLGVLVMHLGSAHTLFIAAISPALGLERLATMPVDTLVMFGGVAVLSVYYIVFAAYYNRKLRRRAAAA